MLSVITVLTYNTWLLWRPINGRSEIFHGYLSELSASDQPGNLLFRAGDLITAVLVAALGVRAIVLWRRHRRAAAAGLRSPVGQWWPVAFGALLVFGVATFLDAFFAMDCSPTLSQACRVAEEAGELSSWHYAHTATSVGAQVGIVVSMVATLIAMLRSRRQTRARRVFVGCLAALEVSALTVMLVMLTLHLPGIGYPQAVMVVLASIWFAAIGFRLIGDDVELVPGVRSPGRALLRTASEDG